MNLSIDFNLEKFLQPTSALVKLAEQKPLSQEEAAKLAQRAAKFFGWDKIYGQAINDIQK